MGEQVKLTGLKTLKEYHDALDYCDTNGLNLEWRRVKHELETKIEKAKAKRGAQPGNRNAAKQGRKRVKVEISLSGERLAQFERYLHVISGDDSSISDRAIAAAARELMYEWIETLVERQ